MLLDGSSVNIGIAFIAGLVSFFAPCVFPLVPAYVGFFAGVASDDDRISSKRNEILKHSLIFALGFLIVFLLLGLSATTLGHAIAVNRAVFAKVGGVVMIALGLYLLGVFKNPAVYREFKIDIHTKLTKYQSVNAFVLGLTFGFAWTPCIGPVLAVILLFASQADSAVAGTTMLLAYGMGIATPFVLMGLFIDKLLPWIHKTAKVRQYVHTIAGVLILVFGIMLLTNTLGYLGTYLLNFGSLETFIVDNL